MKFSFALSLLALAAAPASAQDTVVGVVVNSEDHNVLEAAVIAADYVEFLSGEGPFTVFAPTDAAFAALNETSGGYLDTLLTEPFLPHLQDVLQYHVVEGSVLSTDLTDGDVTMFSGDTATISLEGPMINEASIVTADLEASNGVVHVTDGVLTPAWVDLSIADLAGSVEDLSILVDLVTTAGLVETLSGPGPFTVFAPTNEAFEAALVTLNTTLDELKADTELLTSILTYHVVADILTSEELAAMDGDIETVNTAPAAIAMDGETVTVAGAAVADPDYLGKFKLLV